MSKIEKEMIQAIKNKKNWCKSNTNTVYVKEADRVEVYLHGNHIVNVWFDKEEATIVFLRDAGWLTNTTKSRLNAICNEFLPYGIGIYQKDWRWFVTTDKGDVNWNGTLTFQKWKGEFIRRVA